MPASGDWFHLVESMRATSLHCNSALLTMARTNVIQRFKRRMRMGFDEMCFEDRAKHA